MSAPPWPRVRQVMVTTPLRRPLQLLYSPAPVLRCCDIVALGISTHWVYLHTRDQTKLQNLIFFYCHEILCMIYHIRANTYGFFIVGCSQSCILGPIVG